MGRVSATVVVPGLASAAEALWYDTTRWPAFIDGLGHVASVQDGWPAQGGRVVWDSHPGGRGRVVETVLAYEARRGQEAAVEDGEMRGTQTIGFAPREDGVAVTLELQYEIKERTIVTPLVDALFVRRAQADSLRRTLGRFRRELEAGETL